MSLGAVGPTVQEVDQGQSAETLVAWECGDGTVTQLHGGGQRRPGGVEASRPQLGRSEVGEHQRTQLGVRFQTLGGDVPLRRLHVLGGGLGQIGRAGHPGGEHAQQGAAEPQGRGRGLAVLKVVPSPAQVVEPAGDVVAGQVTSGAHQVRRGAGRVRGHLGEEPVETFGVQPREQLTDRQLLDELTRCALPVPSVRGMRQGLGEQARLAEPPRRRPVQLGFEPRAPDPQMHPEDLGEQGVEPVPRVTDGLDERVRVLQSGEDRLRVVAAREGVGQVGVDLFEDAAAQHQVLGLHRLCVEHLGEQEVGERAPTRFELLQEGVRIRGLLRREDAEPEPGGPAPVLSVSVRGPCSERRIPCLLSSSAVSSGRNARSAPRTSVTWPAAR